MYYVYMHVTQISMKLYTHVCKCASFFEHTRLLQDGFVMAGQFENGLRHGNALEVLNDDWVMVIVCCRVCCSVLQCVLQRGML